MRPNIFTSFQLWSNLLSTIAFPCQHSTNVSADDDDDEDDDITSTNVANACRGDGSFTITANANPALDGCYVDTEATSLDDDGAVAYTVSGTTTVLEIYVLSSANDDTGDVSPRVRRQEHVVFSDRKQSGHDRPAFPTK